MTPSGPLLPLFSLDEPFPASHRGYPAGKENVPASRGRQKTHRIEEAYAAYVICGIVKRLLTDQILWCKEATWSGSAPMILLLL